jgi:hypothetical protein
MRADPMPVTQRRRPAVRTGPLRCSVYLLRPAQLDTGTVFRSVVTQGAKVLRWQVLFGNCGGVRAIRAPQSFAFGHLGSTE